jgi:rubrerythrin
MMSEHSDIEDIIEVLTIAIAREQTEEQFFRRSAQASKHKVAKATFLEIAGELASHLKSMELRREKLLEALAELRISKI